MVKLYVTITARFIEVDGLGVLGVFGSPRKDGLTSQLVTSTLEGAGSAGVQVSRLYLTDFRQSGHETSPWLRRRIEKLDRMVAEADALVLGSPVYYKDVSWLMKEFIDYMHGTRIPRLDGRPALGISVAGGSGMGQITALRSMYGFFFFRGFRPINPIPVSRFNFDEALEEAYASGRRLAELSSQTKPFKGLAEKITYYYSLKYLDYDIVDEILLLAEQLIHSSQKEESLLAKCKSEYDKAKSLIDQGRKADAISHAVDIYHALFH